MRIAFADPPYPGQSKKHYGDHPDYAGEVDHAELIARLHADYDGWCLNTSSTTLAHVIRCADQAGVPEGDVSNGYRIMSWVKPFAAFKKNVPVAYAWEPVLVKAESITLKRGLSGAKPERVCHWLFEVMGCTPDDELIDLFPGSGAVSRAWDTWCQQLHEVSA